MICGGSPKQTLQRMAFARCIPLEATIELTLQCNLRCHHCYNFDRSAPRGPRASELSINEVEAAIDDLAALGCLYMTFTGGEALLYPDLESAIACARKHQMHVRIKSNGTLLSQGRAHELAQWGVHAFDVSLYGMQAKSHDTLTRREGSFAQTIDAVHHARAAKLDVSLSYLLTRHNAGEVESALAFSETHACSITVNPQVTARQDATRDPVALQLDATALATLYAGPLAAIVPTPHNDASAAPQCGCARSVCGIGASGDVYPCIGAPMRAGNIREQSLTTIWHDSPIFKRIRGLQLDDFRACRNCVDRLYCQRSSGVAFFNTGDYTGPEPFTCMQASVLHRHHDDITRRHDAVT